MPTKFAKLLATAATIALVPSLAHAQDAVDASAAGASVAAEIVVLGFGQTRQVQSIDATDIAVLTPGTSPLKAIAKLPGVNFQSSDAFGAYEWSTRISLRGFNQNQLGFTLDGVPLGDMSYGNHNGLHISRAIISENVGAVTVSQGAGALGTASTSNLGGTLQFVSRAPADVAGISASGTYGSEDTIRGYVRLDSGDITGGGLRGAISYAYLGADKWKGVGKQRQHQVNAKLVQDVGTGSITAWLNYSDRRENDYQDLSQEMINRLGYGWDNISGDFELAKRIARIAANRGDVGGAGDPSLGTTYPAPIISVDDAYFDAAGLREDFLGGVTFDARLTDALTAKLTGYFHHNEGQGLWYTPYVGTPGGAPLTIRTTEYGMHRGGVIGSLALETGANRLEIGSWYESNRFNNARRFYGLADTSRPSRDSLEFQRDPLMTQWDVKFDTETFQYHVQDRLDLGALTLNAGWKGYQVTNRAMPRVSGGLASGEIEARDWFLPQVGALFRLNPNLELFANLTQNMRAFVSAATGGPFSTTQAGFAGIRDTLKPERSDTYEIGGRMRADSFQASVAGYLVNFSDRLLSFQSGAGIVGNPSVLQNVGDVRSIGFEAAATVRMMGPLSLFASYSFNDSEYRDDVVNAQGTRVAATRGKTTVDSPKHMLTGEVVYDDEALFARVGANYMSKRYYSYENDVSVDDRVLVDASIGYRFGGTGMLDGLSIEGSVTNLTDERYVSTIGSNGFGSRGDSQTLLAGAPRQWFVTLKKGL